MAQLTIPMLGSFSALLDDEPILTFRTAKVQALLIYLVAEKLFSPTAPPRRVAIMALLWPGMPVDSARQNLRQTLYLLRQIVPEVVGDSGKSVPLMFGA